MYAVIFIRSYIKNIWSVLHRDRICLHHAVHRLIIKQCDCSGACSQKYLSTVTWICHNLSLGYLSDGEQPWLVQKNSIGICWLNVIVWLYLHPRYPFYDRLQRCVINLLFCTNAYKRRKLLLKTWDESSLIRVVESSVTVWIQLRWKAWVSSSTSQSFLSNFIPQRY